MKKFVWLATILLLIFAPQVSAACTPVPITAMCGGGRVRCVSPATGLPIGLCCDSLSDPQCAGHTPPAATTTPGGGGTSTGGAGNSNWGDCLEEDVATIKCLEPLFENVAGAVVTLLGAALFVVFMVGGFTYLLSGGDPKKTEKAKSTLTAAAAGLIIIVASWLIIRLIGEFTGLQKYLETFTVNVDSGAGGGGGGGNRR